MRRLPAMQPRGPVERDLAEPGQPRSASLGEARLVGREREFGAVLAALEGTLRGEGRLLLLAGEPGVGKTRLAREALAHGAHKGFETLVGQCFEPYRAIPFFAFSEALADRITRLRSGPEGEPSATWPDLGFVTRSQPLASPELEGEAARVR